MADAQAADARAADAAAAQPSATARPSEPKPRERDIEGALGLFVADGPDYPGAEGRSTGLRPAGFIRWGRWSLSGAGGFTTKRRDNVDGGLGALVHRGQTLRFSLGLRREGGRNEYDSPTLAGLGEIPRTVQGRVSLRWTPQPQWQLRAGLAFDLSRRVGGTLFDLSLTRSWALDADSSFAVAAGLTAATESQMQAWHGITPEQSQRSGYPVYRAGAGLRDARLSATWRAELSDRWAGFAGVTATQLLGPAARSPLTQQRGGVTLSSGLVWRF
ncbi:MAG: MipA/OmpV family protein [Rubrivivax sp.]|nr:MipA/OmpV family protein [Rubrivivax sp.]